jgi:transposase
VHSHYTRTLADLPWAGLAVQLRLTVRKFRCPLVTCPQQIFTERLPTLAPRYARRTPQRTQILLLLAFALGGEGGARMAQRLHLTTSGTTLLRLLRRCVLPTAVPARVVGLDDWAWCKGQRYGTICVDLEGRRPVDLLPDRTVNSVATWLQSMPSVEIVSRDRGPVYIDGATRGAPQARQVADRWHLLKNWGASLQRIFDRRQAALRSALSASTPPTPPPTTAPPPTTRERLQQQRRDQRYARYQQVRTLHAQGVSLHTIAKQLPITRQTARKYVRAETFPEIATWPTARRSRMKADYLPYVHERWNAGCVNAAQIWRELYARGVTVSNTTVRAALTQLRKAAGLPARTRTTTATPPTPGRRSLSSRQAAWLFMHPPAKLKTEDHGLLTVLCAAHTDLAELYPLSQTFVGMIKQRTRASLDPWLKHADASPFAELRVFANGLRRDYAAVAAALELPWSQGPVEAQVQRLKLLKRAMVRRVTHRSIAPAGSQDKEGHLGAICITWCRKTKGKAALQKRGDDLKADTVVLR